MRKAIIPKHIHITWQLVLSALLVTGILISLLPTGVAQAAIIKVNGTCTLADAIMAANTDTATGGCPAGSPGVDVIELTEDVQLSSIDSELVIFGQSYGKNGLPIITSDIIIMGNGYTIERLPGSPSFRLLFVQGNPLADYPHLTLDNIRLRGGDLVGGTDACFTSIENCGGAISSYYGDVTIRNNSVFIDNHAHGGGAISNVAGKLVVSDSVFGSQSEPNTAAYGGAIINSYAPIKTTLSGVTFTGNRAEFAGGAIYNRTELAIVDSLFTINQVNGVPAFGGGGGALYNNTIQGQVTINTSTFSNNAAGRGGALSNYNASRIVLNNSLVTNNSNNTAAAYGGGGGIWSDNNGYLEIYNSMVTNNQTTYVFSDGGGIFSGSGLNNSLILVNSTVSGNSANQDGGGIYMKSSNAGVVSSIINSDIENNIANIGSGAGIYVEGISPINIAASLIRSNSALSYNSEGGGIFFDNPTSTAHNHTIHHSTIANNTAGEGAGISSDAFTGEITISNTTIKDNKTITHGDVGQGGAGITNEHGTIHLTNSTVSGNRVEWDGSLSGSGAGIHNNNGGIVNVTNSTIANNAARNGGGFRNTATMYFANSIIAENFASNNGNNCHEFLTATDLGNNYLDDITYCPAGFILSTNINLDTLADNGGPTETHALLAGSEAIDAAPDCSLTEDQRGVARGANCDSGAYEVDGNPPVVTFQVATSSIEEASGNISSVDVLLDNTNGNITDGMAEVYIRITGTAAGNGNDYDLSTTLPVTFSGVTWPAPGSISTQAVDFNVIADYFVEENETVVLTLTDSGIVGLADLGPIAEHTVTIIDGLSDLAVTKAVELVSDGGLIGNYDPGDIVRYTVTVTNRGPVDAEDITIEDVLDGDNLDIANAVINASIGAYSATTHEWSLDGAGQGNGFDLVADASESLTIEVPILANAGGETVNLAKISQAFPPGAADPNAANNSAEVSFLINSLVQIDIKPNSYPNSVNINGNGIIPVAILGSSDFDVTLIDTSSLIFEGLSVRTKGNGDTQCSVKDVTGANMPEGEPDGYDDLVCQFVDGDGFLITGVGTASVSGNLFDGTPIYGEDSINLVNE
jgi:hypothetical protein